MYLEKSLTPLGLPPHQPARAGKSERRICPNPDGLQPQTELEHSWYAQTDRKTHSLDTRLRKGALFFAKRVFSEAFSAPENK